MKDKNIKHTTVDSVSFSTRRTSNDRTESEHKKIYKYNGTLTINNRTTASWVGYYHSRDLLNEILDEIRESLNL